MKIDLVGCSRDGNQFWRWGRGGIGHSLPPVSMSSGECLDVSGNASTAQYSTTGQ